nr:caspase family protein [Azospirillum oleiclasticum]
MRFVEKCVRPAVVFLWVVLCASVGFAQPVAGKRVALVIGNGGYERAAALANAPKDARAVAAALRELAFEVVEGYDLPLDRLVRKVRDFGVAAADSDLALVFYAGHGVQVNGVNFLLPVDVRLQDERDLTREAVPVEEIMRELRTTRGTRVVILDACRDNPFVARMARSGATRSAAVTRGMARMPTEGGSVVAYATREDAVAEDGTGEHSPYTHALLKHMATPGLELRLMFGRVATTVKEATGNRQEPFIYDGLGGTEIYLKAAPPPPPAPGGADAYELAFWNSIKDSTNPADYKAYLETYPGGRFAALARVRAVPPPPTTPPATAQPATLPVAPPRPSAPKPASADPPTPARPAATEMVDCLLPDTSTVVLQRSACRARSGLIMNVRR